MIYEISQTILIFSGLIYTTSQNKPTKMLRRNQTYEKFTEKMQFSKNLIKNVQKSDEKTYDSLLADLGKHQTCIQ